MTFYVCDKSIQWFENNYMRLKQEKCHVLVTEYKFENIWAKIGQMEIRESAKQKLLGVKIGRSLNFDKYVSPRCKKAGKNSLY